MDLLVKLYELPPIPALDDPSIVIRKALAPEKHLVCEWIAQHFSDYWKSEAEVAFSRQPVTCILAQRNNQILGFACYETTSRGFFGPTGVDEAERGKGLGKVLLLEAMHALWQMGYAYAFIGLAGSHEFYKKSVGAIPIESSGRSIYTHLLRK